MAIYVDDIVLACPSDDIAEEVYNALSNRFEMTKVGKGGELERFLGMNVASSLNCVTINQKDYIVKLLEDYRCLDAATKTIPLKDYVHDTSEKVDEVHLFVS